MKARGRIVACMVSFAFLLAVPSALAQADKLIGVWKLIELKLPPVDHLKARTLADPQPEVLIFTKKYCSRVGILGDKPRPDLRETATNAQLLEAWKPLNASVGSYTVEGSTLIIHLIADKTPNFMNNSKIQFDWGFKFEGEDLILSMPVTSLTGTRLRIFEEYKYIRLE